MTTATWLEPDNSEYSDVILASKDEKKGLNKNQRRILSKLYKVGEKASKTQSHLKFNRQCIEEGIASKSTNFQKRGFFRSKERLDRASREVQLAAEEFFEYKLEKELKPLIEQLIAALWKNTSGEEFESLYNKWENSMARRDEALEKHRGKKIEGLKKEPKKPLRIERKEREEDDLISEAIQRMFAEPESKKKKKVRRKKKPPSEKKKKELKKRKRKRLKLKTMAKSKIPNNIEPMNVVNVESDVDPLKALGLEDECIEDYANQFFENVEAKR